jgi:putative endonuclease
LLSQRFKNKRDYGKSLEASAAKYLQKKGLRLLTSNYSCKSGEIDLIMLDLPGQLIFVEVRYRRSNAFGTALETIGPGKQQRLKRSAAHFLQKFPQYNQMYCRFDAVAVLPPTHSQAVSFDWIKNAFN